VTTATELVSAPAGSPAYDIVRAAYAELRVTDLDASVRFYADLLGMIVTERSRDVAYLRGWEERLRHSLVLRRGPVPAAARLGFRVRREADLELIEADMAARGLPTCEATAPDPGVGRTLQVWDPFGYPLEFFAAMDQVESQLQRFDLHRGAPLLRFDHLNLHMPRMEEAYRFWSSLGFRCSEYISTDGSVEQLTGAWMLRKPTVHDIALTAGRGPRLHHFAFWIGEPAGVLRACDQLAAAGHARAIERGPGRHGVSNAFFVYLRDPDGHRIELYSCDYYTGDPDHKPLRWSVNDVRCRSFWGTRAPDSWYEESSSIIGRGGALVPTDDAPVDERTEVMV
jgi:3,4-dihydroxyphenylacetate 2,3-dioxygenase